MGQQTWQVYVDGNRHVVELEHGYWSGRRLIRVDGHEVFNRKPKFAIDVGSLEPIKIGSKSAVVLVQTNGWKFRYDLIIDGVSQTTGEKVPANLPTYDLHWGKRPPKWLGGHLSPLEDSLLAGALVLALLGFLYLTLPGLLLKAIGGMLMVVGLAAYFVRHRNMFLVFALVNAAAGIIPAMLYPVAWKAFLLMALLSISHLSLYRKNPSPKRPPG